MPHSPTAAPQLGWHTSGALDTTVCFLQVNGRRLKMQKTHTLTVLRAYSISARTVIIIGVHARTHAHSHVQIHVRARTHTHTCTHTRADTPTHTYTHTHTRKHRYTHTRAHT